MKICLIAPGEISIPPSGWGALETFVWHQYLELNRLGIETYFLNEKDISLTRKALKEMNPDIIHLHYGKHYELMPEFNCRKIVTNYDGSFKASFEFHNFITRKYLYNCEFFCLRDFERQFFLQIGISPSKIKILPLGISTKSFRTNLLIPSKAHRSIFLGKIDERKRQYTFQDKGLSIDFVGPNATEKFNVNDPCYLGVWTENEKFNNLTEYGNLVLLSSAENGNPPLVCLEAISAGLGIVVSEACDEGIDKSRGFITVIPEDKIQDYHFLQKAIQENRAYSIKNRLEILEYARQRDWSNTFKTFKEYL